MIDDDTVHIKHIKQRSANMASIRLTSGSLPYQVEVAVRMIYSTAMGYSLSAVTISEKITNKIQAKALESFVPALGYNRGFPRDVLLGPSDFGGASIPRLHTESNIQQIEILLTNICAQTDLGKLFMINLNWIQILAGIDEMYLNSTQEISYINNCFTGIKLFLNQINGRIEFLLFSLPVVERSGDQCITKAFADIRPKLSKNQIRYCNNWRVYYNVILVSDICNAKGDEVLEKYLTNPNVSPFDHLLTPQTRKTSWQNQPHPKSIATFQFWTSCITKTLLNKSSRKLRLPLGKWLMTPEKSQSVWTAYFASDRQSVTIQDPMYLQIFTLVVSYTLCSTTFTNSG